MADTILLAVDDSHMTQAAIDSVRRLAAATGDTVTVIHAHEFAYGPYGKVQLCCLEGEGEAAARHAADELARGGVSTDVVVVPTRQGSRALARRLIEEAEQRHARLIAVCSRGRSDAMSMTLGSLTHRLLHFARQPVLVLPAAMPETPQPTDPVEAHTAG